LASGRGCPYVLIFCEVFFKNLHMAMADFLCVRKMAAGEAQDHEPDGYGVTDSVDTDQVITGLFV
jgi:hypothetical protein